jgi:protein arginine kinase activator
MTTCDFCDDPAEFTDVQIKSGVHTTKNYCKLHAAEAGFSVGQVDLSVVLNMPASMLPNSQTELRCSDCGMSIAQYKEKSLLGCPTCYETFASQLKHVIANVQDNHTHHIGRAPSTESVDVSRHLEVRRLLKQLDKAVTQEKYEQAADIRDKIRSLHDGEDPLEH